MKAQAPGKLILSGEHSVVYGAPALALAVAQSVVADFTPQFTPKADAQLSIASPVFGERSLHLAELSKLKTDLDQRFQRFEQNLIAITEILHTPEELLFYTLAVAGFQRSGHIELSSQLPTGSGMGSSAAVIAALLCMAGAKTTTHADQTALIQRIRYCERLQHGRGSALDATAIVCGGVTFLEQNDWQSVPTALDSRWFVWDSGRPLSSTGETVEHVRQHFAASHIWQAFTQVTEQFKQALLSQDKRAIADLIQQNHRLLCQIGVVPTAVAARIEQLEQAGCAAKICGAGSIEGEQAGLVLVYIPQGDAQALAARLGLDLQPLRPSQQGVHIIHD